jgi:hypothetical protein
MAEADLPSERWVWGTFAGAIIAAGIGAVIFIASDPNLHLDPEGFAVFAPIYVAAQAIERLLEPIAGRYNTTEDEKKTVKEKREKKILAEQAVAAMTSAAALGVGQPAIAQAEDLTTASAEEEAATQALEKKRGERKLLFFFLASALSCVLAGVLGLGLYEAMSTQKLEVYLGAIDVAVTGLVIGAGTKPLHDLIARLEKSKENADPSDKPTSQLPTTTAGTPARV